jgi:predicted negative regulator of RcsB-dependent stress response
MKKLKQTGFSAIELLLILAVLIAIGLVGYKIYSRSGSKASESNATGTSQAGEQSSSLTPVPEIKDKSDLDMASTALDQADTTGANSTDNNALQAQSNDL